MKWLKLMIYLSLVSLVLLACGTDDTAPNDTDDTTGTEEDVNGDSDSTEAELDDDADLDEDDVDDEIFSDRNIDGVAVDPDDLSEEISATMLIEGMNEDIQMMLYHNEEANYSVYLPEDFTGEFSGHDFLAYSYYNNQRNGDVHFFIKQMHIDDALEHFEREGFTSETATDGAYDITDQEWLLKRTGFMGRIGSFVHDYENYVIGYHYPEEHADGFSARHALITDYLFWHE